MICAPVRLLAMTGSVTRGQSISQIDSPFHIINETRTRGLAVEITYFSLPRESLITADHTAELGRRGPILEVIAEEVETHMKSIASIRIVLLLGFVAIGAAGCQSQPSEAAGSPPEGTAVPAPAAPEAPPASPVAPVKPAVAPLADTGGNRRVPVEAPAPPAAVVEVTIPEGTELSVELLDDLSSETATAETTVRGRLRRAVEVNGRTALPAGATLTGAVTDVVRPGRVKGRASLSLRFASVTLDGERSPLATSPITVEGEADTRGDVTKIGVGAGVGAVVGGILGGGGGAAKGAAIGGAAGTGAVLATRGKDVQLASGTTLSTTLTAAKTLELPR
jgi:hypothetical protein